jgi:hypothetical protein
MRSSNNPMLLGKNYDITILFTHLNNSINHFLYHYYSYWGKTESLGTAVTTGLLYQPQMIGDGGEIDGMKIARENQNTRRKSAPAPLCP